MAGQLSAGLVVRHGSDASPHIPGVVAVEVFFNSLLILELGLLDTFLQLCSSPAISQPISQSEGSIPRSQQGPHCAVQPWFLVGKLRDGLNRGDTISAELNIGQYR